MPLKNAFKYLDRATSVYSGQRNRGPISDGATRVVLDSGEALSVDHDPLLREVLEFADRYDMSLNVIYDPVTLRLESLDVVSERVVLAASRVDQSWILALDDARPPIIVSQVSAATLGVDLDALVGRGIRFSSTAEGEVTGLELLSAATAPAEKSSIDSPAGVPSISETDAANLFHDLCLCASLADAWMPQVAFLYPRNFCWARAHWMCHVAWEMGVDTNKIWHFTPFGNKSYQVKTPNDPRGFVDWSFHVAPVVKVTGGRHLVLDPALFRMPVPPEQWCSAQTSSGVCEQTSRHVYRMDSTYVWRDPDLKKTRSHLAEAFVALKLQQRNHGRPPYRPTP